MVHIDSDNVGLYKDERLAVINNANGPKLNRTRKNITDKFKSKGLSITIETNLVETGFLGVTFILSSGKYYSYNKPNNAPLHIHREYNHPPSLPSNDRQSLIKESQIYSVMKAYLIMLK